VQQEDSNFGKEEFFIMLIEYNGKCPHIGENVFIAPNAMLIGDVTIEDGASIWFGVVLRADQGQIIIKAGANIQDNSVLHTNEVGPTYIGENVTIGHSVSMEGCRIERHAVIGMNTVVLEGATVGEGAMVAANSVVGINQQIPAGHLAAGAPAQVKKPLSGAAQKVVEESSLHYHELRNEYLRHGIGLKQ
jgi:carbonic anhydrase/acetyltransferase-like protein (isoleucine patch superfamily)